MALTTRLLPLLVASVVGCSHTSGGGGSSNAPVDAGPLEVTPAMYAGPGQPLVPIADGDRVGLSLPPQGGHVLFVGARMRNLATDTIDIDARILDPTTDAVEFEDKRTVVVRPAADDPSIAETDPETYTQQANVAVCPDHFARAVVGQPWTLELEVRELYVDRPRDVVVQRTIVPTCPTDGADAQQCACECDANYTLGKCPK